MVASLKVASEALRTAARREIGRLSANLAGDSRYTDVVTVALDDDLSVTVALNGSGPAGGMDTLPGSPASKPLWNTDFERKTGPNAQAKEVVELVYAALRQSQVIKRYGKPTKDFEWTSGDRRRMRGLSIKLVQQILASWG